MRSHRSRFPTLRQVLCLILCLGILLLGGQNVFAQSSLRGNDGAPVVLDGRVLFKVNDFRVNDEQTFTAEDRAQNVNERLAQTLDDPENVSLVQIPPPCSGPAQESAKPPVLKLAEPEQQKTEPTQSNASAQYLITVTQADLSPGGELCEQALEWQKDINEALKLARDEREKDYVQAETLKCIWLGAIAILVHLIIRGTRKRWIKTLQQEQQISAKSPEWVDLRFISLASLGLQTGLWLGLAFYVTNQFPVLRQWRFNLINNFATQPLFELNDQPYSILDLLLFLALVLGLWVVVRSLTLLLRSRILDVVGIQRGLQEAISILTQYLLTCLGLILILQVLGIDISSILILGGALGVGIGFGLQNIVNNFISGIILLLERPMEVGDFVNIGDLTGTVERIGARSTELRTLDQVTIIVPNAHFLEKEVINWDHGNSVSRLHLPVGVAYGSEIDQVQEALLEAVCDHPEVLAYPRPQVWMKGFGDSALEFEVLIWLVKPREQFRLKSDLYYRILASLRQHHIEIPYPQRDLHVRSPQVNYLIERLIQQYPSEEPEIIYPTPQVNPPQEKRTRRRPSNPIYFKTYPKDPLLNIDLNELIEAMRGPQGLNIKDRRYRLNFYPQCFVGTEAVQWLMKHQKATRESAIRIGQRLIDEHIIHHVLDEHPFKNANLFYRFYEDENDSD